MRFQETETVELKSIVMDDLKKEIIAFANCDGGTLYVGVADDGTVLGVENADECALQISNMMRDAVKPDVTMFIHYETLDCEGKAVVAVNIQRGTNRPYYLAKKGLRPEGVYVRQGYSSVPATDTAIRQMIKETDGDTVQTGAAPNLYKFRLRKQVSRSAFAAARRQYSAFQTPFLWSRRSTPD